MIIYFSDSESMKHYHYKDNGSNYDLSRMKVNELRFSLSLILIIIRRLLRWQNLKKIRLSFLSVIPILPSPREYSQFSYREKFILKQSPVHYSSSTANTYQDLTC